MTSSDALVEAVPDGLRDAPPVFGDLARAEEPNGRLDGAFDQHALLEALQSVRLGNFSVRLPGDQTGLSGKIADTFN